MFQEQRSQSMTEGQRDDPESNKMKTESPPLEGADLGESLSDTQLRQKNPIDLTKS